MMRRYAAVLVVLFLLPLVVAEQKSSPAWYFGASDMVNSVSISGDGKWLVAGGDDTIVWVFTSERKEPIWRETLGGYAYINSVAMSQDGSYFVVGCNDGKVILYRWRKEAGYAERVWTYSGELKVAPYARAVAISGDGSYLIVGTATGEILFFSKDSKDPLWTVKCGYQVLAVDISADGKYAVAAADNGFYVFDQTGLIFSRGTTLAIAAAISGDGSLITVGNKEGRIWILSVSGQTVNITREIPLGRCVWSLDVTPDGRYIVAAIGGDIAAFYKFTPEGEPVKLRDGEYPASAIAISSDGSRIFAADSRKVYYFKNDQLSWECEVVKGLDGNIECVGLSSAGEEMAACTARSPTEHRVYFFKAVPIAPKGEGGGMAGTNMILVAVGLVVALLVIVFVLRRRISKEVEI